MSRGYDWEASFGGCATGTTDKNDEFRPKNAVFRFKLKEINFEAVQTCIVEEFLFWRLQSSQPCSNQISLAPNTNIKSEADWSSYLVVPKFNQQVVKIS